MPKAYSQITLRLLHSKSPYSAFLNKNDLNFIQIFTWCKLKNYIAGVVPCCGTLFSLFRDNSHCLDQKTPVQGWVDGQEVRCCQLQHC